MTPTGWQVSQGRQLAGLSQAALSEAAGVGLAVVVHAELLDRALTPGTSTAAIRRALEAAGVEFVRDDGGVGVQMRQARP